MLSNVAAYVSTQLVSEFRYARRLISPSIPSCISCGEYAAKALLLVSCYQQGSPPCNKNHSYCRARRAASGIQHDASLIKSLPELIDRETGVREILEILQSIIAQAGDLIESRSPELVAAARAALTRYHDDTLGQAE